MAPTFLSRGRSLALALLLACGGCLAASIDTRVSGVVFGNNGSGNFTCYGMPTCAGTMYVHIVHSECSNASFSFTTDVTINGLDLTHPGPIGGTAVLSQVLDHVVNNPDGSCAYALGPGNPAAYTGTWDGQSGTFTIQDPDTPVTGTFTASLPASSPVFPMTVSGSVTTTSATVNASIQPRSQDTGKTESVYVFVHAPSNLVTGAIHAKRTGSAATHSGTQDDAVVCVLAQVNASGQLVAASSSSLQPYLTGVLTAQAQSVQLLNNVPTANVAGASVFVGYGESAAQMLSGGVFQAAISLPGAVQCTANLASAPVPNSPGALTGLWWNANESGWGVHFTQRGSNVFAAWYTYDATGKPKWYVAPNCATATSNISSGSCSGTLYEVNGPTFFGVPFVPITASQVSMAGNLQVAFTDPNNASMSYTVAGVTRTVPIARQVFNVPVTSPPAVDYTDLWWNASESGWGMAITQQYGNIFLAWYVYDSAGKPTWYVAPACAVSGSSCSGSLYTTTGPPFGPTFDPTKVQAQLAGSAVLSFIDANNAVLSYTVGTTTATKTITRQLF